MLSSLTKNFVFHLDGLVFPDVAVHLGELPDCSRPHIVHLCIERWFGWFYVNISTGKSLGSHIIRYKDA